MKYHALAFAAGLASACGFAPLKLWPLTLAAVALLLWLIEGAPLLRTALARGWWFGVGHFTIGLNWIATAFTFQEAMPAWLGWIAVVLLSLYLAVYPAAAAGLAWRWGCGGTKARPGDEPPPHAAGSVAAKARGSGLRLALVFAAAWIVTEWLRASLFTGFAWNPLGVALLPTWVSQVSPWIGTYGLSGVTSLIAAAFYLLARRKWAGAGALLASVSAATGISLAAAGPTPEPTETVIRIVQPNIGQQDKWREGFFRENVRRLRRLSRTGGDVPRLLLWPEAAVTAPLQNEVVIGGYPEEAEALRKGVGRLLGPRDLLLTGGVTWRSTTGFDITSATNSVFAMDRSGRILGRYDKAHLVPYGEYLPMRPILSAIGLSRLAPGDVDFDPGPGPQTLDLPIVGKAGFQLCYEIIFSGEVVDRKNRPNFLFNPSNDAWFGAWGPPQHLAQARLRALEEGLPILRSTPTGISAVIDSDGELLASLPWKVEGAIDAQLPAPRPPTLFARLGNILPLGFALLLAALAVLTGRRLRAVAERAEAR